MNKELYDDFYEKTKDYGRSEFVKFILAEEEEKRLLNNKITKLLNTNKKLKQENNQLKENLKLEKQISDGIAKDYEILLNQKKKLKSWLEAIKTMYENEYKDVDTAEHYNSVLSKLNELEGGKNE